MCGDSGGQFSIVRGNVWGILRTLVHGDRKCVGILEDSYPR